MSYKKDSKKAKGKGGSSCHQCKSRRNFNALTYCTSNLDKKNKRCRKKFCGHCLKKFYKELPVEPCNKNTWVCPSCRKICCCAACRRRKTKEDGVGDSASDSDSEDQKKVKHVHHKLVHEKARAPPKQVPIPEQRVAQKRKAIYSGMLADMYPQDGMQVDKKYKYAVPVVRPHSSPPVYGQTKVNVNAPSIPTLLLSSEHLSSPMTTPLHAGHRFDAFESIDPLSLTASAANNTISEASKTRIPNTQYSAILSKQIRKHAQDASQNKGNSQFTKLYSIAQAPTVNKKIEFILARTDIGEAQKVEFIASLLRIKSSEQEAAAKSSSSGI